MVKYWVNKRPERAVYSAPGRSAHPGRSENNEQEKRRPRVRSSEYFRAQARLYRDLAQLTSDRDACQKALASAADYLDRAEDIEREERDAQYLLDRKTG